jgi:hypothetical protein
MFADDLLAMFWTHPDPAVSLGDSIAWDFTANLLRFLLFVVLAIVFWIIGNMIGSPFWEICLSRASGCQWFGSVMTVPGSVTTSGSFFGAYVGSA